MRQVLRSRRLEGRLFDFSPGRKSQYEIWAKLAKEILASKVRKEERRKELIINLLAILSFWMLKVSILLTKEFLNIKVLTIVIFLLNIWCRQCHLRVLLHFTSLIISTIFTSVFQLLFYLNYLPLYICMETEFFAQFASQVERQVTESKSLCELD